MKLAELNRKVIRDRVELLRKHVPEYIWTIDDIPDVLLSNGKFGTRRRIRGKIRKDELRRLEMTPTGRRNSVLFHPVTLYVNGSHSVRDGSIGIGCECASFGNWLRFPDNYIKYRPMTDDDKYLALKVITALHCVQMSLTTP